jgi:hypothetical protein
LFTCAKNKNSLTDPALEASGVPHRVLVHVVRVHVVLVHHGEGRRRLLLADGKSLGRYHRVFRFGFGHEIRNASPQSAVIGVICKQTSKHRLKDRSALLIQTLNEECLLFLFDLSHQKVAYRRNKLNVMHIVGESCELYYVNSGQKVTHRIFCCLLIFLCLAKTGTV